MELYETLKNLGIEYQEISHKAIFTVAEALKEKIASRIEGTECKNLFVKSKSRYYLIFLDAGKRADLKFLARLAGESKLSFASDDELNSVLNLEAGSVTPLGIINDSENKVTLLLDRELAGKRILVHPNTNTRTISISFDDLLKFISQTDHEYHLFP